MTPEELLPAYSCTSPVVWFSINTFTVPRLDRKDNSMLLVKGNNSIEPEPLRMYGLSVYVLSFAFLLQ